MTNLLILDACPESRHAIQQLLADEHGWCASVSAVADEALELVRQGPIDIVVADLKTIGEECGKFVRRARQASASMPLIVTSAPGCENLVVDALEAGAANYLPRHFVKDRLVQVVSSTLATSQLVRRRNKLLGTMDFSHTQFTIPNDLGMVGAIRDRLQSSMTLFGICDESEQIQVGIALDEALANAYYHGNLEVSSELKEQGDNLFEQTARERLSMAPYNRRRIFVEEYLTREEARFVIRDEGPGFDVSQLPDPRDVSNLDKRSGRGVMMMRYFMTEVSYGEKGNEVTLVKRRSEDPAESNIAECLA
ncbi:Chemotaxis protein CheY [Maioricimonas rarisocia]|uniref:Chemotaxis protein CheY n=1 Tax=Maioricimonas rarisocia TaxID=2528026 RepID=A0A517Z7N3_9PLAN|nr:ATP-binding protein [Maioricimonas rarisocia]QDU38459.1 Chemotaxis protein CheY [Maioricimonas rarisocia]